MTKYDFHPEAAVDLDEIWDFIAEDNLDAADKVIADILAAIEALVSFPRQGHRRPDLTSRPLRFTLARDYLICLRARCKALVGGSRDARPPQPTRYGRHSSWQGMSRQHN